MDITIPNGASKRQIGELLIKQADKEAAEQSTSNVIVRTVTHYYTGRIIAIRDGFMTLADAAWIADTGRWSDALCTGKLNEVEPYPGVVHISLGAIVDYSPWQHPLPREQK